MMRSQIIQSQSSIGKILPPQIEINECISEEVKKQKQGNSNHRYQILNSPQGIKFGESQLNVKLEKAKSKADLFGEIRNKIGQGETVQEFIMNH